LLKGLAVLLSSGLIFAALPATTNYQLNSFGFGSGGTANSNTPSYSLEGITGEASGSTQATTTYTTKPGFIQTEQANVPKVTLSNPSNYYDKLKFIIDKQNNPTDALYELQVCIGADFTPSCGGTLKYLKSDDTLGASLSLSDYQTYAAWGGATGQNIIGLSPSTTYYIHIKATQGKFTESAYGPSSNATTIGQTISFCLYSNANCAAGGASEAFGSLTAGSITNSPTNIGVDFATNADSGGSVYIYSLNGGLKSVLNNYTITSASANLTGVNEGFGARVASSSQLSSVFPYNQALNTVGLLSTTANTVLNAAVPVVGGTAAIQLQAKASNTTPAATDYAETITVIAAASF
jgi:hypothetical protein